MTEVSCRALGKLIGKNDGETERRLRVLEGIVRAALGEPDNAISLKRRSPTLKDTLSGALNVMGAVLDFDVLPFHPLARASAASRGVDLLPYAFGVGDWGILYAVSPLAGGAIADLKAKGLSLSVIGLVEPGPGLRLRRGAEFTITAAENEHFRHRMEDQGDYFDLQESSLVLTPVV